MKTMMTLAYRLDCKTKYQDTDVLCVYTRTTRMTTRMTTTLAAAEGEFVSMAEALVAAEDAGAAFLARTLTPAH